MLTGPERCFAFPQGILRPLQVFDIDVAAEPAHDAAGIDQLAPRKIEPAISAVRSADAPLQKGVVGMLEVSLPDVYHARDIVGMIEIQKAPFEDFALRETSVIEPAFVDKSSTAIRPCRPYENGKRIDDQAEVFFAGRQRSLRFLQCIFGLLAVFDIQHDTVPSRDISFGVEPGFCRSVHHRYWPSARLSLPTTSLAVFEAMMLCHSDAR